jgi:hypothetical protein
MFLTLLSVVRMACTKVFYPERERVRGFFAPNFELAAGDLELERAGLLFLDEVEHRERVSEADLFLASLVLDDIFLNQLF